MIVNNEAENAALKFEGLLDQLGEIYDEIVALLNTNPPELEHIEAEWTRKIWSGWYLAEIEVLGEEAMRAKHGLAPRGPHAQPAQRRSSRG